MMPSLNASNDSLKKYNNPVVGGLQLVALDSHNGHFRKQFGMFPLEQRMLWLYYGFFLP